MQRRVRERVRSLATDKLHLILMPTESCNFRCTYCYESFALGRMQPGVVRGVKELLSRRADSLGVLDLSWFGGEPLLARDIVEDVMTHAKVLARERHRMHLNGNMTTNGFRLEPACFRRLLELGVTSYQISFDGPRFRHDQSRVRAGGAPTFDRIWANLLAMRDIPAPFEVVVRLHVDRGNVSAAHDFVDDLAVGFGGDPRFELFPRPILRLGGAHDSELPFLTHTEAGPVLGELACHAERAGVKVRRPGPDSICYAAQGNSFVVRADGRLGKCTVVLDHPRNQVGRLGEDGTFEIDSAEVLGWMRGLFSGDREELRCPMRGHADDTLLERL